MQRSSLRRLLFSRLVLNLAVVLGGAQLLIWHWWRVVARGEPGPGPALLLFVGVILVAGNALSVPLITRLRRRRGHLGLLARAYTSFGVATLVAALAVGVSWLVFLLPAGVMGLAGVSPDTAFGVFRVASVGFTAAVALAVGWGFTGGQSRVAQTHQQVPIPGLDPTLSGLRLVQISDLHIGNACDGPQLARLVDATNAADPDVLVLTGDLFDFDPSYLEEGARALGRLRARHGVYAILGNHDTYVGADRVADALARHAPGLRLLRDECVRLPLEPTLYLAGVEDPGKRWYNRDLRYEALDALAAARPSDGPTLLLIHQPEAFGQAADLGFPFVLAGHTHGGQLALPGATQLNLARLLTPMSRGVYRRGASTLYVNRGLGVGGPALRIACQREIASFSLVPAETA